MKERILLVEDNKTLAKLLAKKMENSIDAHIDVVHTLADTKKILAENSEDYFIALLDLNLPDAPDGQIVDYVLSKNILVIVLTGNIDEETKKTFIEKDIVDYVYKSNINDVNYIFTTIDRLFKNREHEVMVVDDSMPMRNNAKKILQSQQFKKVYAAAHGEEAMRYFEDNPEIKLVLTDYNMPVKNGLELTSELRVKYNKNDLGIIAVTGVEEEGIASAFLKHGANDFVTKPFIKDELICRVNNLIESMENIQIIGNMANTDFLTGVYNRRYFFDNAQNYLKNANMNEESYVVAMFDIDYFKKINDTYGHDCGDFVIKKLAKILDDETKGSDIVARFGGEEFCVLLKNITKKEAVEKFVKIRKKISYSNVVHKSENVHFTVSIGLAFSVFNIDIHELIDRADMALYNAKENGRNRVEIYDME